MSFTIPIIAACQAGIGLGPSNHSSHSSREDAGPAMNLQVSISIPIKDLLEAFTLFGDAVASPPVPRKQVTLSPPSASASSPKTVVPLRRQNGPLGPELGTFGTPATWESVPIMGRVGPSSGRPSGPQPNLGRYLVHMSNLSKRISKYHGVQLQKLFTEQVGPVECQMEKGSATMAFSTQEQADEAVNKYNGGILELTASKGKEAASSAEAGSLALFPYSRSLTLVEDRLGPLSNCGLVRGRDGSQSFAMPWPLS